MIYAYDVVVNFNRELYDFYDWKTTDDITHYRKIPLIKVSEKTYKYFVFNQIKVDSEFSNLIKDKAQVFVNRLLKCVSYAVIITNGYDSVAVKLDKNGYITHRSRLNVNDELEILELSNNLKVRSFKYELIGKKDIFCSNFTRDEKIVMESIVNKLKEVESNSELLNYLYYEWTGNIYDGNNCLKDLINEITSEYSDKCKNILKILEIVEYKNV